MIKINKGAEPIILKKNKADWTKQLLDYIAKGEKVPSTLSSNYNQKEVRDALRDECRNKCMYCESYVAHITHEHIEHIKPKAKDKFPELSYEWSNLGLACPVCNMNKGAEYDNALPFVNPYIEEPSDNFIALGNYIYNKPGVPKAELTNRKIQLNRHDLLEKRKERIDSIIRLIKRYHTMTNMTLKNLLLDEIEVEIQEDKPYSLCAKSIFQAMM